MRRASRKDTSQAEIVNRVLPISVNDDARTDVLVNRKLKGLRLVRKRSKYNAKRCEADGISFDSMAERDRYLELKLLEKAGKISALAIHTRWPLDAQCAGRNGLITVGYYVDDFSYVSPVGPPRVVEDVKGVRTALYNWKRKHFEAQYGIKITEISMRKRARRAA